ncbi:interleukin-6 [Labeo rohita]|uniref:Interleukin-6 n=1 Tax=Labeo rohita TaxID=84645 RepID=A0A498LZF8_LABRO|nr:interleukin-6 [Labeo rohita]RXN13283.1 interleukin-6 [Labeo rohita]
MSAVQTAFIYLVDAVPTYSGLAELPEISGDEVQDVDGKSPLSDRHKWHLMAKDLHRDVKMLRDQQFERDFRETVNMTAYEGVRIKTPLLKPSDGCLSRNFSTERCLKRIYSVLTWYKENWSFIENENLTSSLVNDIKHGTKRLLEAINSQVDPYSRLTSNRSKNGTLAFQTNNSAAKPADLQIADGQADQMSSAPLSVKSAWTRKTAAHSILFNFTSMMIDTCRAINYMSKHKTAHRGKDMKRPRDWSSDKN